MKNRVRAVIELNNQLFMVQHVGYQTWCLPGGGIEPGESLTEALSRELVEELGVLPVIGPLLVVHQFKRGGVYDGPEFFFRVMNPGDFTNIDLNKTSHGASEIADYGFYDVHQLDNVLPTFLSTIDFSDTCPAVVIEPATVN